MQLSTATVLSALLACALAASAPAQTAGPCPNTRATNVPAQVSHDGPPTRCGVGVQILGLPISIGGAKCYPLEIIYPAHQECLGAENVGTQCEPEAAIAVQLNRCECVVVGVLGTGISIPKCSCTSAGGAGTVEDAQTVLCHGTE